MGARRMTEMGPALPLENIIKQPKRNAVPDQLPNRLPNTDWTVASGRALQFTRGRERIKVRGIRRGYR